MSKKSLANSVATRTRNVALQPVTATLTLTAMYCAAGSTRRRSAPVIHGLLSAGDWSICLDNPTSLGRMARAMLFQTVHASSATSRVVSVTSEGEQPDDHDLAAAHFSKAESRFVQSFAAALEPRMMLYVIPSRAAL